MSRRRGQKRGFLDVAGCPQGAKGLVSNPLTEGQARTYTRTHVIRDGGTGGKGHETRKWRLFAF